ncbi:DUF2158 domain-containing protein [Chryseobacterium taihuense]|uniref:Uncharacterized small protein n=1 Tax=Chryseobacterium taihuense TaxID=1141221 RepID=A0ABY0R175_9FLAO|nr:DUF2158 domain-containing protein [Chryseobacterium taihuense]SDM25168.1 Uncharacterized small protein [Chryseobacterium taihuense]
MAQSNFQVGDKVILKTGGPEMTIQDIITKDDIGFGASPELEINVVVVNWFNVNNDLKEAEFKEPQLEKVQNLTDEYFKSE